MREPKPDVVKALVGREIAGRHTYRIERPIGQGGTSTVYRGRWLVRDKPVAIKVMHAEAAQVPELQRRFEREVATAKRLDHPNVVAVTDNGTLDDGSLFLVMELLDGELLSEMLRRGPIEPGLALDIARQLLDALRVAHAEGVVHRDIKPHNVMLTSSGLVKLFDFGIAFNDKAAIKLTAAGTAFGTPEYISPEMAMGQKVDGRADLYSLGVMLFEMVTGRLPFERDDPLDLLRAHINEKAPTPRDVTPEVPKAVDALIARAMSKPPGDRFPDADAMIAAVESVRRRLAGGDRRVVVVAAAVLVACAAAAVTWYLR